MSQNSRDVVNRRDVIKKTASVSGVLGGIASIGTASADGGWSSDSSETTYSECVYSRSVSGCYDYDYWEEYGTTRVPTGCAKLSTADILIGTGVCTLWIGAAVADGFPGDEAIAWKTCGASTIICGIQRKLANTIDRDEPVEKVERYKITEDHGKFDEGDVVLKVVD